VLFSLLDLNVRAAFPIMASAASFAGPLAAIRFLAKQRCDLRVALGLTLGGTPGVLLAAFVVKSLPLAVLRWLVVAVIVYTALDHAPSGKRRAAPTRPRSRISRFC
jgi:uncharacterized membrane protein YfcA